MDDLLEIINRIENNIDQDVNYTQLCKGLSISSSSLQRVFPPSFPCEL